MQRLACHEFVSQNPGWFIRREFYDNGIEVWSVKEGQQVFDSYVDDLMNYIRFWIAKTESIKIALRVRTRLRQMVEEGKYTGGTNPYGYKLVPSGEVNKYGRLLKKMEIEPDEADIIRFIFYKTTVEGVGSQVLANTLNNMGVKTYRYMCTNRTLCRNECKGQGTFSVIKVDDLVRKHLKNCLKQLNMDSQNKLIELKYQRAMADLNSRIRKLKKKERTLTKQLKTLYSEVPDSISGNSAYSPIQLSDIINDLKDRIDDITEKLEPLENEKADKQQLQMSIQHRYEKYQNLLMRFFEKGVGDDEKRMIILKLFERITVSRGTEEYDIKYTMRSDYEDFV